MLGAGVPVNQALDCAADAFGGEAREAIKAVSARVDKAESISEELRKVSVFSSVVLELWRIGEEVGNLDFMCKHAADMLEMETMSMLRQALVPPEATCVQHE